MAEKSATQVNILANKLKTVEDSSSQDRISFTTPFEQTPEDSHSSALQIEPRLLEDDDVLETSQVDQTEADTLRSYDPV